MGRLGPRLMQITFDYTPLDVHQAFHRSRAEEACSFGAVGSGKSYALVSECIARCLETPGLMAMLARLRATDLRDSTETIFFDILPYELKSAGKVSRQNNHNESFTFPNGSKVLFRGVEDWEKQKSVNFGWIGLDEASQLNPDIIEGLSTRLRQTVALSDAIRMGYPKYVPYRRLRLATNPNGKDWCYDRYINPQTARKDTEYFTSTAFDNPYLPADFIDRLLNMPEPWIRRFVLCQFDDFGGMIYPDWTWDTHTIEVRRDPWPAGTVFFQAADPGWSRENPFGALWAALDRANHRLVIIEEYLESGRMIREHAREWRGVESRLKIPRVTWRTADPAIDTHEMSTGMTRKEMFSREGFTFNLGPKGHDIRVPALGELVSNLQIVAQRNCPQFHDQMTKYRWVDLTPTQKSRGESETEKVQKGNDHLIDCAQYLAAKYRAPLGPRPHKVVRGDIAQRDFEIRTQIRRNQRARIRPRVDRWAV